MPKTTKRDLGTVRKLSQGKYLLRISDGFDDYGRRKQPSKTVYCSSDREAERELIAFYYEVKHGTHITTKGVPVTLSDLFSEWMKNHVSTLAVNTRRFYETNFKYIEHYGKIKTQNGSPSCSQKYPHRTF